MLFVHVYGNILGVLWWSSLQDRPWSKLEERRLLDKFTLSRCCFRNMFLLEFLHLGSKVIWCSTFYNNDCHPMHVDGCQSPACLYWILFRIQETVEFSKWRWFRKIIWKLLYNRQQKKCIWSSRSNKSNPSSSSWSAMVYELDGIYVNGRRITIWSRFHWIIFHFYSHLGERILLSLWILVPCLCHSYHCKFTNCNCHGLFPTLCWR